MHTLTHTLTIFHMAHLFSCVLLYINTHNHEPGGHKGHTGVQAQWKILMELWCLVGPNTSSLTRITGNTHTGNGFTEQGCNASSKKTESYQISALWNTPPPSTHLKTSSLYLFSPPSSHVIKLSAQNQEGTNITKNRPTTKTISRSMTANIVNFNDLNQSNRKIHFAGTANHWPTTHCFRLPVRKANTESINIKNKPDGLRLYVQSPTPRFRATSIHYAEWTG